MPCAPRAADRRRVPRSAAGWLSPPARSSRGLAEAGAQLAERRVSISSSAAAMIAGSPRSRRAAPRARVLFHDVQRSSRGGQLRLKLSVPGPEPLQLSCLCRPLRTFRGSPGIGHPFPSAAASRARAHSITCDEYRPSRRQRHLLILTDRVEVEESAGVTYSRNCESADGRSSAGPTRSSAPTPTDRPAYRAGRPQGRPRLEPLRRPVVWRRGSCPAYRAGSGPPRARRSGGRRGRIGLGGHAASVPRLARVTNVLAGQDP